MKASRLPLLAVEIALLTGIVAARSLGRSGGGRSLTQYTACGGEELSPGISWEGVLPASTTLDPALSLERTNAPAYVYGSAGDVESLDGPSSFRIVLWRRPVGGDWERLAEADSVGGCAVMEWVYTLCDGTDVADLDIAVECLNSDRSCPVAFTYFVDEAACPEQGDPFFGRAFSPNVAPSSPLPRDPSPSPDPFPSPEPVFIPEPFFSPEPFPSSEPFPSPEPFFSPEPFPSSEPFPRPSSSASLGGAPATDSESSGVSLGVIIGAAVGGVALLAAIIGGLVWWRARVRRRRRAANAEHDIGKMVDEANDVVDELHATVKESKGSDDGGAEDKVEAADVAVSGVGAALSWMSS